MPFSNSLSPNLRFPGLTLTQELEGASVEFISYCMKTGPYLDHDTVGARCTLHLQESF